MINHVPDLLAEKFGGAKNVNIQEAALTMKLTYSTAHRWAKGQTITKIDTPVLEAWCKYLECGIGDILEYVPNEE